MLTCTSKAVKDDVGKVSVDCTVCRKVTDTASAVFRMALVPRVPVKPCDEFNY